MSEKYYSYWAIFVPWPKHRTFIAVDRFMLPELGNGIRVEKCFLGCKLIAIYQTKEKP